MSEEKDTRSRRKTASEETSLIDEIFVEYIQRIVRDEAFDPKEMLESVPDSTVRRQLHRLIENYRNRSAPSSEPGTQRDGERWFGKFLILGELGRGGMGIVYLAHDATLNRKVALKVLPENLASEQRVIQRFLREAEAAARLRHPSIISIYQAGETNGTYYYSMEYVPGITLAELNRALRAQRFSHRGTLSILRVEEEDGPVLRLQHKHYVEGRETNTSRIAPDNVGTCLMTFPRHNYVRQAIELFIRVADALDYAHREGVIHRDIKPSNLILAPDERFMIADFGLAKVTGAQSITRTGEFMGSPSYISPEQAMTRRIPQNHRSDIWSLGVVLYEFLTLRHPFESRNIELTLKNIILHEPVSPRSINSRLPKDMETIILKMLEKNPDNRYATAGEVSADLRCVLNYESIQAKSHSAITRGLRFIRRNRAIFAVGFLALALLLFGGYHLSTYLSQERRFMEQRFGEIKERLEKNNLLDQTAIDRIQKRLRDGLKGSNELSRVVHRQALEKIDEIGRKLSGMDDSKPLKPAVALLAELWAIQMHQTRETMKEVSKDSGATTDICVQLVWRIAERLSRCDTAVGEALPEKKENPDELWDWLCAFLGITDRVQLLYEGDHLVSLNALEAMRRLRNCPCCESHFPSALYNLVNTPMEQLTPRLLCSAIDGLADLQRSGKDPSAITRFQHILPERSSSINFLVRYRILEVFRGFPPDYLNQYRDVYDDIFKKLSMDPEPSICGPAKEFFDSLDKTG